MYTTQALGNNSSSLFIYKHILNGNFFSWIRPLLLEHYKIFCWNISWIFLVSQGFSKMEIRSNPIFWKMHGVNAICLTIFAKFLNSFIVVAKYCDSNIIISKLLSKDFSVTGICRLHHAEITQLPPNILLGILVSNHRL